ncbi:hypothetical protein OIV83_001700 [Microbotryomycetes sp. JL201]|nr:hypothetical protein OIV83_001700 [Microbotryomycetes sp. JL201]
MGLYIPPKKRVRLLKYKYSSADKSLTSKYLLNPFWNWLVTLFPKSMAPNAITLLGLSLVFANFLSLLYYNPTLSCGLKPTHVSHGGQWDPLFMPSWGVKKSFKFHGWMHWTGLDRLLGLVQSTTGQDCAPRWLYWTFAGGLFMYQSLDAIDGKQARRTGTSGPLGELFDHGCDAINTTLGVLLAASALNLGLDWWTPISLIATSANFYLTTWEEFHTGTLYLSVFSGPVEGILMIVILFVITGFKGPQFWDQGILTVTGLERVPAIANLGLKNIPVNESFLLFSAVGLLFNIVAAAKNVYAAMPNKNKTPLSLVRPLARLSPFILHTTVMVLWLGAFQDDVLHTTLLIPFMFFWGLSFAHHVQLLILSHLTSSSFPAWWKHPLLVLSMLGAIDANAPKWFKAYGIDESFVQTSPERVKHTILSALGIALIVYGHFAITVINDICDFYGIKPEDGKSPAEIALEKKTDAEASGPEK